MEDINTIQSHNHDGVNSQKVSSRDVIPTYSMTSEQLNSYLLKNAIEGDEFNVYISDTDESVKYVRINGEWVVVNFDYRINYFGSGADGDVIISTDTTLTADKNYNSLTINDGVTLNPGGYRIFVKEETIFLGSGKIARNGNSASGSTGGAALAAGTIAGALGGKNGGASGEYTGGGSSGYPGGNGENSTSITNLNGAAGGQGGDAVDGVRVGGAGGTAGTATGEDASFTNVEQLSVSTLSLDTENIEYISNIALVVGSSSGNTLSNSASSGAGGGGATDGNSKVGGNGGGSGGNGGVVYLASKNIITVNGSDFIQVKGGNGADGADAPTGVALNTGGGGGGGAGGNGGLAIVIYRNLSGTGTINVSRGTSGVGGAKGQNNTATVGEGRDGTNGSDGKYIKIKII